MNDQAAAMRTGATVAEWQDILKDDRLWPWVLPVVCNRGRQLSRNSQLSPAGLGKQPSMINGAGLVHGIKDWTRRPALTPSRGRQAIAAWQDQQDYGFCVRTGHNGLIAVDADVNDIEDAERLYSSLCSMAGVDHISRRRRGGEGASRWAALLQLTDDDGTPVPAPYKKLVYSAPRTAAPPLHESAAQRASRELKETGKVEILTAGQQLVCAGMHCTSGTRYQWDQGIAPVKVTREQFVRWLAYIKAVDGFGAGAEAPEWPASEKALIDSIGTARQAGVLTPDTIGDNPLARWLVDTGRVIGVSAKGLQVVCPWEHLHTTDTGPGATLFIPAGTGGCPHDGFQCLHAHCEQRTIIDAKAEWQRAGYEEAVFPPSPATPSDLVVKDKQTGDPVLNPDITPEMLIDIDLDDTTARARAVSELRKEGEPWYREKDDTYTLDQRGIHTALHHNVITGLTFVKDTFTNQILVRHRGQNTWRPLNDTDYTRVRIGLELNHCRRLSKEMIKDGIEMIAEDYRRDLCLQWLRANIPAWDGVPRIEKYFPTYCGSPDSPYTRATGLYTFTALWGRATAVKDPIKADIVPVLVGPQGARKSDMVRYIVPLEEWAGVVDFSKKQEDMARSIQGRVAVEVPELAGMDRKSLNEIKMFITLPQDSWVLKYHENAVRVNRRCLFIMTTNERELFSDSTGNRRYAPIEVQSINISAVRRDILQLWAEARELYKVHGVMWQELEELARSVTPDYQITDSWQGAISDWAEASPDRCDSLTPERIMTEVLGLHPSQMDTRSTRRICTILRDMGYSRKRVRDGQRLAYRWAKAE